MSLLGKVQFRFSVRQVKQKNKKQIVSIKQIHYVVSVYNEQWEIGIEI